MILIQDRLKQKILLIKKQLFLHIEIKLGKRLRFFGKVSTSNLFVIQHIFIIKKNLIRLKSSITLKL